MKNETKQAIIEAAKNYMLQHEMSELALSKASGINNAYLNVMLKGETHIGGTEIKDKYYLKLAEQVGYQVTKDYWPLQHTNEFKRLVYKLEKARNFQEHSIFIAPTGRGKSYTTTTYLKANPNYTYCVTVSGLANVRDIINQLLEAITGEVPVKGSLELKKFLIVQQLRDIRRRGGKPLVIFDESENMKLTTLQMIKSVYDGIKSHCGIVLVGTEQLLKMLDKLKKQDKQGVPQFYRRFKANICVMQGSNMGLEQMVESLVQDTGLRKLLLHLCENYGELHDYLHPVLRQADIDGVPVTEELFRRVHDMPK